MKNSNIKYFCQNILKMHYTSDASRFCLYLWKDLKHPLMAVTKQFRKVLIFLTYIIGL